MDDIHFKTNTVLGTEIHLDKRQWQRIIMEKHPSMNSKLEWVKETITDPELVRQSRWDQKVSLFYKKYIAHFCCVVVKIENDTGFVITAYLTDKIKIGETQWKR